MGSKGNKQTTSTTQQQSYTPDPRISAAAGQALTGAQSAAQQPFQMPVAPVAGFSPFQEQAFNQVQGAQGMSLPYFDDAAQFMRGSASPISEQDIGQYYNPMAQSVTNQLQNIFGQQNRMATSNAVRSAGGVGADRIGVAQGNLANQQTLAAGQVYSGLYDKALAAAQQNKQMMAGAGYGLGQLGPAAQASYLQGTSALGQAGAQQQGLTQAQQNAIYQQRLAEIAYPFQTPQYLAGITGGLAPALGGSTYGSGTSTTTMPTPSPLNQILGIGGALLGTALGGPMGGMMGGSLGKGAGSLFGGGGGSYGPTYGAVDNGGGFGYGSYGGIQVPTYFRRGGKVIDLGRHEYSDGGSTYGKIASQHFANTGVGNPYADDPEPASDNGYADGGDVDEPPPMPGSRPIPIDATSIVPKVPLRGGAGHAGARLNLNPPAQRQSSSGSNTATQVASMAAKFLPMLMAARGGPVNPFDAGQGFEEGGDVYPDEAGFQPPEDIYPDERGFQTYGSDTQENNQLHSAPPIPMLAGPDEAAGPSLSPIPKVEAGIPLEGQTKPGLPDFSTNAMPAYPGSPIENPGGAPGTGKPNYGPLRDRVSAIRNVLSGADTASAAEGEPTGASFADRFGAFQKPSPMQGIDAPMGNQNPFGGDVPLPRARPDIAGPSRYSPQVPPLSPQAIAQETIRAATDNGVPVDIALRLIRRESGFRNIRGAAGEYGPAQLMPRTARELGIRDPSNTYLNIHGGMKYLRQMYDKFGNWPQAIAAYNAGPDNVARGRIPASTRAYVADVGGNGKVDVDDLSARERSERPESYRERNPYIQGNEDMTLDSELQSPRRPYPDSLKRDWGQNLARSPWSALIVGGAKTAQTAGPVGSAIGAGIEAGMGHLDKQRKDLRSEEELNMKADALFQHAKQHLDKYQRMTPYEEATKDWRIANAEKPTAPMRTARWLAAGRGISEYEAYEEIRKSITDPTRRERIILDIAKNVPEAGGSIPKAREIYERDLRELGHTGSKTEKPKPTQADLDYLKAHKDDPAIVQKFKERFGEVEPS